jgi:hypothetical protein
MNDNKTTAKVVRWPDDAGRTLRVEDAHAEALEYDDAGVRWAGRTIGQLTAAERSRVIKWAARELQAEFNRPAMVAALAEDASWIAAVEDARDQAHAEDRDRTLTMVHAGSLTKGVACGEVRWRAQISEPLSPAVDCPDCRRAVEDAWDEARSENIKRWTFGGPACSSECLKAADDDGHLYSCQRKAYICAGATSEFLLPGVMAARWPYDAGRILVVEDAWDQAHAEQADRDLSADPERLADFQDRVRQAFDVAEEVADREAHRATGDLAALAESVVVMPIASATAVSAALGAGQLAILVSQEVIDAALAEIAEQSGVPLEQVRELHDAVLNGQFPMDDGDPR